MNSNSKVYVVMAGYCDDDATYAHSVHTELVSAESMCQLITQPDDDGYQDKIAYVTEAAFYDQDA